ncbi:MAG: Crp/Fnr family transcriptional regulator [Butyrivibrio sp.]|nr:Crp/Fnr family transcriptional regulator [Butyrivibrio sp.]
MLEEKCLNFLIEHVSFWEHLSQEERERLINGTSVVSYKKGTLVHGGNEDCIGIFLVRSGQFRTYLMSEDGREITLYRLYAGDVCILSASCVLEAITFDVYIDAEEDTEALLIDASVFRMLAEKNIYVQNFGYRITTGNFSDVMWAMQQILFMGADKRLAIFLIDETSKNGTDTVKMTHEQIARLMGSAREVVSRMLKYFEEENMVTLSRGEVRISDRKKLRALTE